MSGSGDATAPIDLGRAQRIHVVGIGGAGMSAIATVLCAMGHTVSGSDLRVGPSLDALRAAGATLHVGHDATHLAADVTGVAVSTAIAPDNPEVIAARARGVPVWRRAAILAALCAGTDAVAVAGTHGKTTTASMLALVLREAGMHPSFIIGGDVNEIGSGAVWDDRGSLFVVEADESDGTFLELPRIAAIVTNAEPDHLEHYGGWPALELAFERFIAETPGPVVVGADDETASRLGRLHGASSFGTAPDATYRYEILEATGSGSRLRVAPPGAATVELSLPVAGPHNAADAVAALSMALELGAPVDAAINALGRFAGVARRFQHRGRAGGVTFIDDYAHLPTEVRAALAAARAGDWRRVVCVFQPHRYSRTAALWHDFAGVFGGADELIVTEIYAAGEAPRPGVSGERIVEAVRGATPEVPVRWIPHRDDLVRHLIAELREGDLCLTLGAGDLTTVPDLVRDGLEP